MNNYEDIKSMSIDQLASFLANVSEKELCAYCANKNCMYHNCGEGVIKWLESESEEG